MEDGTAGGNRHAVDDDRALELAAKPVAGPMLTSVDSLNCLDLGSKVVGIVPSNYREA